VIVVIPSSRSINLDYLSPLIEAGARFIIVDDTEGTIRVDHPQFEVFNWGDRRRMLGDLDVGMPRRNGACRDFGFYVAWREASDDEIVIALDDDCMVDDPDFAGGVHRCLNEPARAGVSGAGEMFNVLDVYEGIDGTRIFPRGFPYSQRGAYQPWTAAPPAPGRVLFNLGMWTNVFDVNAIDKIRLERFAFPDASLKWNSVVVPPGCLVSACSMNMHFRVEAIPAVYQVPMHVEVVPDWVIDRYGDIWGGFILKTLLDIRGDRMTVGQPMIRHLKAGDMLRNVWQEHLGHLVNDEFIRVLAEAREEIASAGYVDMMDQLREQLAQRTEACSPILASYFRVLVPSLSAWVTALRRR
jgi:hypothetical protein